MAIYAVRKPFNAVVEEAICNLITNNMADRKAAFGQFGIEDVNSPVVKCSNHNCASKNGSPTHKIRTIQDAIIKGHEYMVKYYPEVADNGQFLVTLFNQKYTGLSKSDKGYTVGHNLIRWNFYKKDKSPNYAIVSVVKAMYGDEGVQVYQDSVDRLNNLHSRLSEAFDELKNTDTDNKGLYSFVHADTNGLVDVCPYCGEETTPLYGKKKSCVVKSDIMSELTPQTYVINGKKIIIDSNGDVVKRAYKESNDASYRTVNKDISAYWELEYEEAEDEYYNIPEQTINEYNAAMNAHTVLDKMFDYKNGNNWRNTLKSSDMFDSNIEYIAGYVADIAPELLTDDLHECTYHDVNLSGCNTPALNDIDDDLNRFKLDIMLAETTEEEMKNASNRGGKSFNTSVAVRPGFKERYIRICTLMNK